MRLFGEQRVDPFPVRNGFRTDGQSGQVAMSGNIVQRLIMQLIGVEEGLQAV
ncbi:hypothetical protein D3C80_1753710 [compost metagenome]